MVAVIDTLVQLAPIVSFFMVLALVVLVVYFIALLGDAYKRMGTVAKYTEAIFKLIFGEEGLTEIQNADEILNRMNVVLQYAKQIQVNAKAKLVTPTPQEAAK